MRQRKNTAVRGLHSDFLIIFYSEMRIKIAALTEKENLQFAEKEKSFNMKL